MIAGIVEAALGQCFAERNAEGTFPNLEFKRDIAEPNRLVDRLGVGRDILDIVSHRFEDLADRVGHHNLA